MAEDYLAGGSHEQLVQRLLILSDEARDAVFCHLPSLSTAEKEGEWQLSCLSLYHPGHAQNFGSRLRNSLLSR
jgi:hypothetical protein